MLSSWVLVTGAPQGSVTLRLDTASIESNLKIVYLVQKRKMNIAQNLKKMHLPLQPLPKVYMCKNLRVFLYLYWCKSKFGIDKIIVEILG